MNNNKIFKTDGYKTSHASLIPELHIQKMLRSKPLEEVVEQLKLECKKKGDLVLLKYKQIESDFSNPAVQECRGIILDAANEWAVVSYPFNKFFNHGEGNAHPVDWNQAKCFLKLDGSMMCMYFYNDEWHVQTSGTIDAETAAHDSNFTFKELFWNTYHAQYNKYGHTREHLESVLKYKLDPRFCYIFELCTPYNIVVTQHTKSRVVLIGVRNKETLQESYVEFFSNEFDVVESVSLTDIDKILETFADMSWQEEGYVVRDMNFNRVKIKNPAYVAVHHTKSKTALHHVMQIIKDGEVDEYLVYFEDRKEEILRLQDGYEELTRMLTKLWVEDLNCGEGFETQKEYALKVLEITPKDFTGLMFGLKAGKHLSVNLWLKYEADNKFLYHYLINQ